ncbi:POTRA domain-containing protein [Flavicella sediminum]|uniref:POTRA domain-containing protein n=1 Tax=Flavicella sediminum TaxID=2585141 RepID=UPI00112051F7|nr:POTRA domain-containing protein [Flavicella sediminum]
MHKIITLSLLFVFSGMIGFSQNNTIENFEISGNKKIKMAFLKRVINLQEGSVLDSAVVERDIRFLKRLPSVANASYTIEKKQNGQYRVVYQLVENFTIIPSFNVYTSNNGEFAYRIGLSEFNLFGKNMVFGGFFQKDIYNSYGIHFKAPYLFSKKMGLSLAYKDFTTQEPVFFEPRNPVDFKYNNVSYEAMLSYELDIKNKFEIGVNLFTEDYEFKRTEGDERPDPPITELITDKQLYKFVYEYNNVSYDYQYVSGFKNIFNYQYVTTNDETASPKFSIAWNDFLYYKRYGVSGNLACRLRLGLATNNNSPFAPFSLDNNVNIRGVGNTIDRGTGVVVLNTEYRQTLFERNSFSLQGNAFVDSGSWRNPGGDLGDFSQSENIRVFSGVGLRFIHKKIFNAVFRIDYGFGLTENTQGMVFGIGQYF